MDIGALESRLDDHLDKEEDIELKECRYCKQPTGNWDFCGGPTCDDCENIREIWANPLDD